MKEVILSNCEKSFILNAVSELKRLDGRKVDEFRDCNVYFGTDWGLCYATLGDTRVITQVSCEVQQPKTTRPNEGLLYLNVEVSPMAAPHIEQGRMSDINNHLNRLLEKCIKDSKAIDLESLCLILEEKVWALRVDVNILSHDGNLVQAASISAMAALAHFKRPDVTTNGEEIVIHDYAERDPIPITLHHFPVCITFALINNGNCVLSDPTFMEEKVADASLIFGVNAYGEICALHMGGNALVEPNLILKYGQEAARKAKEIVQLIKEALEKDTKARQLNEPFGLVDCIHWEKCKSLSDSRLQIQLSKFTPTAVNKKPDEKAEQKRPEVHITDLGDNCAELVPAPSATSGLYKKDSEQAVLNDTSEPGMTRQKKGVIQIMEGIGSHEFENYGKGGVSKWEIEKCSKKQRVEDSNCGRSDEEP